MVDSASAGAAVAPAALLKTLRLRLDSGAIITTAGKDGEAELLDAAAAFTAGQLTEAHLLNAQALLCQIHAKLPDEGHLRTVSAGSKRSADTNVEVRALEAKLYL